VITVGVAEDQELVRGGFVALLDSAPDIEVAGQAADGLDAIALARRTRPDVADPLTAATRILILTTFDLDSHVHDALRAGASGFLLKDVTAADLLAAIRVVAAGEALLAPRITRRLISYFAAQPTPSDRYREPVARLTARERELLVAIARGLSNAEISQRLHISVATTKTHVSHLLTKLDVRDRVQLTIVAYESGLVQPGAGGLADGAAGPATS
jgi:DNA-binding NarL/FixJ family response regulator